MKQPFILVGRKKGGQIKHCSNCKRIDWDADTRWVELLDDHVQDIELLRGSGNRFVGSWEHLQDRKVVERMDWNRNSKQTGRHRRKKIGNTLKTSGTKTLNRSNYLPRSRHEAAGRQPTIFRFLSETTSIGPSRVHLFETISTSVISFCPLYVPNPICRRVKTTVDGRGNRGATGHFSSQKPGIQGKKAECPDPRNVRKWIEIHGLFGMEFPQTRCGTFGTYRGQNEIAHLNIYIGAHSPPFRFLAWSTRMSPKSTRSQPLVLSLSPMELPHGAELTPRTIVD